MLVSARHRICGAHEAPVLKPSSYLIFSRPATSNWTWIPKDTRMLPLGSQRDWMCEAGNEGTPGTKVAGLIAKAEWANIKPLATACCDASQSACDSASVVLCAATTFSSRVRAPFPRPPFSPSCRNLHGTSGNSEIY